MKKLLTIFLIFTLIFCSLNVSARADISDWAREHFDYFETLGVNISTSYSGNYTDAITRLQFAQIIYDSYTAYTGEDVSIEDFCPFSDTDAPAANAMYILDIAKGDENGNFNPDKNLSRQEAAKMLCNYYIMLKETELSPAVPKAYLYDDYEQIAPWAVNFISSVASAGIMSGREQFVFAPLENLTIEEATVLLSRAMQYNGDIQEEQIYQGPSLLGGETSVVSWNDLPDSEKYYVKIKEYRNTTHGLEMGSKDPEVYLVTDKQMVINTKPVRRYEITVTEGSKLKKFEVKTSQLRAWSENLAEIENFGLPETQEEATLLMEDVTVDVWTIQNGEKVPSQATFTVHKAIAEKVKLIFKEIFEGNEKFPINSIGGYAWRGGKSEHNYGTAIDINPDQNYCLYTNGTIVGSFYKPYVNPYSITPFGEVVEIFEKYGFNWGADTWRGNRDYMHFSYCGT